MAKFPSQNKMLYAHAADVSNDGWTVFTTNNATNDGTVSGDLNLPKDLSILNRRGYASTTRKGVPLVFRAKIDLFLQDEDGYGLNAAVGTDFCTTLKVDGCQNNWVVRNAAVKWHAALASMRKQASIKRSDLGAYAHEIRYLYDSSSGNWIIPTDGNGDSFTGGEWDHTRFTTYADQDFALKLVGTGTEEETQAGLPGVQNMAYSYMMSRAQPLADSNEHISETPSDFSILRTMLEGSAFEDTSSRVHDAREDAEDQGDNPPYELIDISDSGDVDHDITEPVELGRAIAGLGNAYGSVIVDIPFGIAQLQLTHYDAADSAVTSSPCISVEVLDIYEMQG